MGAELTQRRRDILEALVNEYVAHATPVASRVLSEQYGFGVSSATVRSELAHLEETGYVTSPHTSAGRVPTDSGYRTFVDDLMSRGVEDADAQLSSDFTEHAEEVDDLLREAAIALTEFTDCLAVLSGPIFECATINRVSLTALSSHRILLVLITTDGRVLDTQRELDKTVSADTLAATEALLGSLVDGKCLQELDNLELCDEALGASGPLIRQLLPEVSGLLREGYAFKAQRHGVSMLLQQPEFANAALLAPIMSLLEDNMRLLALLESALDSKAPLVHIGHENGYRPLSSISIVAHGYRVGDGSGLVAVLGPTRMDYARTISGVTTLSRILEGVL